LFQLSKIKDRVFLLRFDREYDLAMSFLRYQEFYESLNPRFLGKKFTIAEYMAWYSADRNPKVPVFSYVKDWGGFNLPLKIIDQVNDLGIDDPNHYDALMKGVNGLIKDNGNDDPYLIGTCGEGMGGAFDHEMSHALFYTNEEYRDSCFIEFNRLPQDVQAEYKYALYHMGYPEKVYVDELQAYIVGGNNIIYNNENNEYFAKAIIELHKKHK